MTRAEIYAEAKKRGALIDLSSRAKWLVRGADRIRFLNGQVSNDVRKLKPSEAAIHACVLTAKGKMCGDIFISAAPDFLRIDAEASLRESLAARLERYIIADDVMLEDINDTECLFHVVGVESGNFTTITPTGDTAVPSKRFGRGGIDFAAPRELFGSLRESLSKTFVLVNDEIAEVFRIEAGVPKWGAELDENTLPHEAELYRDAIDFHKGCYVGQEVISRIKSVGHVNRSLRGFVSDSPLVAGAKLFLATASDEEKSIGELTSAAWSFGLEKWAALGYLKRGFDPAAARSEPLQIEARGADGTFAKVEVRDLPLVR